MNVHIDVVIRYGLTVEHNDLPGNWPGMDHEAKDEWIREWIEQEQPIVVSNVIGDHGDITWYEDGN